MDFDLFQEQAGHDPALNDELVFDAAPDPVLAAGDGDPFDKSVWSHEVEIKARHAEIGTNVTWYNASSVRDTLIFINQLKGSWPWSGTNSGVSFDDHGYVSHLPEGAKASAELLRHNASLAGMEPFTGTFRLYGQGEGQFSIGNGVENNIAPRQWTSNLQTEIIDGKEYWYTDFDYDGEAMENGSQKVRMFLRALTEGDHIRDLALIHHSHLDEWRDGEVYAPEFIDDMDAYGTLRFMDWMSTNVLNLNSQGASIDAEQRYIDVDHFTYNTRAGGMASSFISSAPIEHIVELCNIVDADAWINLAADISDSRALQIATYMRDNLEDGLSVYFEYGNEIWNGARGFRSHDYAEFMANETFEDFSALGLRAVAEWAGYRGPQLYDLIDMVFEGDDADVHYIAPGWAHSTPVLSNGAVNQGSFAAIYFEAEQAQLMDDAPSRPADIVTDYAVGMYHGGLNAAGNNFAEIYDTDSERAEMMARWLLFGLDADNFYDLGASALETPATIEWRSGLNIAVSKLVANDVAAGLDPLRDLLQVLRLNGTELQYRGLNATDWTTIVIFDTLPTKDLAEMIHDVELIGLGYRSKGEIHAGIAGSVLANTNIRLAGHVDYVEKLGLNFVSYEGGPHLVNPPAHLAGTYTAFSDEGWGSIVMSAYMDEMDKADLDLHMNYMSHNRSVGGDFWGSRAYTGQSLDEALKARFLEETIAMGTVQVADDYDPAAALGAPKLVTDLEWREASGWIIGKDGTLIETLGRRDGITGVMQIPEGDRSGQILSFDIVDGLQIAGNKLRVFVQAYGNGQKQLGTWEGLIVEGAHVEVALSDIPEQFDYLRITVSRFGERVGSMTLGNFEVIAPQAEPAPEPAPAREPALPEVRSVLTEQVSSFDDDAWTADRGNWVLDDNGTAIETAAGSGMLSTVMKISEPASTMTLSFDVSTSVQAAGKLRVFIQAAGGGGSTELLNWEGQAVDGKITLDLKDMPERHTKLRISIRRAGNESGELSISNFDLSTPIDPLPGAPLVPVI